MRRYLVYRSNTSRSYLCVCLARSCPHALKVAGRIFDLSKTAWAQLEATP